MKEMYALYGCQVCDNPHGNGGDGVLVGWWVEVGEGGEGGVAEGVEGVAGDAHLVCVCGGGNV